MLPPDKRATNNVTLLSSLLAPVQWLRDLILGSYKSGSTAQQYAPGIYQKYDQVIYNKAVYSSLIANNTDAPTVGSSWELIQDDFQGVDQRVLFNGQKLILEYSLNNRFGTVFRQPNQTSDIYISNNQPLPEVFQFGTVEADSSDFKTTGSDQVMINNYTFSAIANFLINVPMAVYNDLDATGKNNENIIRSFVNKYIPVGINYGIQTY